MFYELMINICSIRARSDRADQEGIIKRYTLSGQNLGFIIKGELGWRDFYRYITSVGQIDEVDAVPEDEVDEVPE